jgi:hypothetical protein
VTRSPITEFQAEVAQVFFSLPEAESFLLAGGLALAAHGLSGRPTEDFDAFTWRASDVTTAFEAFAAAAGNRGWRVNVIQSSDTFVRLDVVGEDSLLVDIALDSAPGFPPVMSVLGPTFAPEELAGRKLLALFDRAMPRDFVDVYVLAQRWEPRRLIELAKATDAGFELTVLLTAMRQLDGFSDVDLPIAESELEELRTFFRAWIAELEAADS